MVMSVVGSCVESVLECRGCSVLLREEFNCVTDSQ